MSVDNSDSVVRVEAMKVYIDAGRGNLVLMRHLAVLYQLNSAHQSVLHSI